MMRSMLTSLSLVMIMTACNIEIGYPAGEKNFIAFNRLDMDDSVATEAQEEQRMLPPPGAVHTKQHNYPFARLAGRAEAGAAPPQTVSCRLTIKRPWNATRAHATRFAE